MAQFNLNPDGEQILRRAVASIQANLALWDQDFYVVDPQGRRGDLDETEICDTTACLAGWIVSSELKLSLPDLLERYNSDWYSESHVDVGDTALSLLGLPECDGDCWRLVEDQEPCASAFRHAVFYATDYNGRTPGAFEKFVAYLSGLTGIDFELN